MPTGYTAGIIDGTTKDFKEYATLCMRNFGALMHMRDDSFRDEWKPRVPSDYHIIEISKIQSKIINAKKLSLRKITAERKSQLKKDKYYHSKKIKEVSLIRIKLQSFLYEAKKFSPPTKDHEGIKSFMIQQLVETIRVDGDSKYHEEALETIATELKSINPEIIKYRTINDLEDSLKYHKEAYAKEVKQCEDSNRWVLTFLSAII